LIVGGQHTILFIDHFIAVVVDAVVADLLVEARNARILIIAVAPRRLAVPDAIAIPVGIATEVFARA
jgi:hypothetical protein